MSNYRSPQPRQQTSFRMNGILRTHLAGGGEVRLEVVVAERLVIDGEESATDLHVRPVRLLVENAALLRAATEAVHRIHNL